MKRRTLAVATLGLALAATAGEQPSFRPPVDYDISLAGNFGEPRPHHFHGGLDIRTDGVEGKHVYAIGDGYVSRVTCGLYGFGNAVYVTHPSGYVSVYCHLKQFTPRIRAAMRRYQYRHETSEGDARFTPADVPVSAGQLIALSGNTGHSTAPHLHLEIHDALTWNMIDPYRFLNEYIQDTVPPEAHGFMAVPLGGVFNGSTQKQTFGRSAALTAWGTVGFAVWADDYMQNAYNHYGIHETLLYADGQLVFHSVVDDIPTELNRMVNSWGDYDHWLRHKTWYMKSFVEPGNRLACLQANGSRGLVSFSEEREYHLEYVLRDYKGNESRYPFTVVGRPSAKAADAPAWTACRPARHTLRWNRTNAFSQPGVQLIVPYGLVAVDTRLQPVVRRQPDRFSDVCQFASSSVPLMADALLSLYVRNSAAGTVVDHFDTSKLYIANERGRYCGGEYHDGWVTGRVRELAGRYEVAYDEEPPAVSAVSLTGNRLLVSVTDGGSGVAHWRATVDGRFVVFDAVEKSSLYACQLRESWLRPTGTTHELQLAATDHCGNTRTYRTTFSY